MQRHKLTEVSPIEDLMREHGVLNRVLLIYEEIIIRLKKGIPFNYNLIKISAEIIRNFIEDYHEQTEEKYIFPLIKQHHKYVQLIDTLLEQHKLGRALTDHIMELSRDPLTNKDKLINMMTQFTYMYRAHESREDTEIFQELHYILTPEEYKRCGDKFEEDEHKKLGEHGFSKVLDIVKSIEKKLDISDISKYSPTSNL